MNREHCQPASFVVRLRCSTQRLIPRAAPAKEFAMRPSSPTSSGSSKSWKLVWLAIAVSCCVAPLAAQTAAFVSFEAPDAGTRSGAGTVGISINKSGTVTGYYIDASGNTHGFVRSASGQITEFDAPGLSATAAGRINASGQILGEGTLLSQTNPKLGFLRNPNGKFVLIKAPGTRQQTLPSGINDTGEIAGSCLDSANSYHGFVRDAGGNYTVFDEPNAVKGVSGHGTIVSGINANGVTTGYYSDTALINHGFTRDQFGNFTSFDSPGAGNCAVGCGTAPTDINLSGSVAGNYVDNSLITHSFVRDSLGNFTDFDAPGASQTFTSGINDGGEVVGTWSIFQSPARGFTRDASGNFTTFSAPLPNANIFAYGINNAGRVTGYYTDANGVDHGFVR